MEEDRFKKVREKGDIEPQGSPSASPGGDDDTNRTVVSPVAKDPLQLKGAEDRVPAEWKVGDFILDLYEVKQVHEGGGMGLVYRVHQREWDFYLAVKSPRADFFQTDKQKDNFIRECETWIGLGLHPNTVSCHYVRTLGGIPWVFAEYVVAGRSREAGIFDSGTSEASVAPACSLLQLRWLCASL